MFFFSKKELTLEFKVSSPCLAVVGKQDIGPILRTCIDAAMRNEKWTEKLFHDPDRSFCETILPFETETRSLRPSWVSSKQYGFLQEKADFFGVSVADLCVLLLEHYVLYSLSLPAA